MSGRRTRLTAALLLSLGLTASACGGSPASTGTGPTKTVTVTASPDPSEGAAPTKAPAPTATGDRLACDDMETAITKLSKAAAGWVPAARPFDQRVGTQIRLLALDMAVDDRKATTPRVRAGVHDSAVAFSSLARAMAGNNKTKVLKAVGQTRVAYSKLKSVCGL
jgi:hypothetical protein